MPLRYYVSQPLSVVNAAPQLQASASTTVTLVDVLNLDPEAIINGDGVLEGAKLSAVGTAKGGAATTYDVEVVDTALFTNAAGATVTSIETDHGLHPPLSCHFVMLNDRICVSYVH